MPPPNKTATISGKPVPKSANTTASIAATVAPKEIVEFRQSVLDPAVVYILSPGLRRGGDHHQHRRKCNRSEVHLYLPLFAEKVLEFFSSISRVPCVPRCLPRGTDPPPLPVGRQ